MRCLHYLTCFGAVVAVTASADLGRLCPCRLVLLCSIVGSVSCSSVPDGGSRMVKYQKLVPFSLKTEPELSEKWVQALLADDPSLLGLGDIILKDKERIQRGAGVLDLLFQEAEGNRRYEVEVQLGRTDETHIVRTLEYWDLERKRYPQYDHAAVIVAEDITSRFLNVISLFNGHIPLIAIKMSAFKLDGVVSVVFTKVLDETVLGLVGDDEEAAEVTDRAWWETRGSKATVALADDLLAMVNEIDDSVQLKYNKFYIGLASDGQPNNFVTFRPNKSVIRVEPKIGRDDAVEHLLAEKGLDVMDYDSRWGRYRIRLDKASIAQHSDTLRELFRRAYEESGGSH